MAKSGDVLDIPELGIRIRFLQTAADTGGELAQFEASGRPRGFLNQEHVHVGQTERLEPLTGAMEVVAGGETIVLHPGDVHEIAPGTPHTQRPVGDRRRDAADHGAARGPQRGVPREAGGAVPRRPPPEGRLAAPDRRRRAHPRLRRRGARLQAARGRPARGRDRHPHGRPRRARRRGARRERDRQRVPVRRRVGRRGPAAGGVRRPRRRPHVPAVVDAGLPRRRRRRPAEARQGVPPALQGPPAVPPPHRVDDHAPGAAARRRGRRHRRPPGPRHVDGDADGDRDARPLRLARVRRPPAAAPAHAAAPARVPLEPQLGHRARDRGPRAVRPRARPRAPAPRRSPSARCRTTRSARPADGGPPLSRTSRG